MKVTRKHRQLEDNKQDFLMTSHKMKKTKNYRMNYKASSTGNGDHCCL